MGPIGFPQSTGVVFNPGPTVPFLPSPAATDEPSNFLASQRPDLPNADTFHLVVKFKLGCQYLT